MFDFLSKNKKQEEADLKNLDVNKILSDCYSSDVFVFHDGFRAANIHALLGQINFSSEESFRYHVNNVTKKNDFAQWIAEVLGDYHLANELRDVFDKKKYVRIMKRRVEYLDKLHFMKYMKKRQEQKTAQ